MAGSASNSSRTIERTGSESPGSPVTGDSPNTRPVVDVTAVTTRDDFLLELGDILGGQASVRPVDSMAAALEHISNGKRAQVLIIDSRDVSDLRADVESAQAQGGNAVVLVCAAADAVKQINDLVQGLDVFAFLSIPLDKRDAGPVIETAMTGAVARKLAAPAAGRKADVTVEPFVTVSPSPGGGSGSTSWLRPALGAGIVLTAVVAGAILFMGRSRQISAPPTASATKPLGPAAAAPTADETPAPAVETSLLKGKVDELLEKARLAMHERRFSEPLGDNALLYYRSATAADPHNAEALDGLQRLAGLLASRCEDALSGGRFDEAALSLASLKTTAPQDGRIPGLESKLMTAQVSKALADGNLDRATSLVRQAQSSAAISADQISRWRAELARRQEDVKVQRIAELVTDRIRDGKLLDPADDSAKIHMQQLRELAPSNGTTQHLSHDLNAAYLRKAREAGLANHTSDVDRWLGEAKAGGVTAPEIAAFQHELTTARQKAVTAESDHLVQLARERIRDGQLTDPTQDSASYYVSQLQTVDSGNANIAALSHDLAAKLLDRARTAPPTGDGAATVDSDLAQAKHWGADPKDVAAVQQAQIAARSPARAGLSPAALVASLKRTRYVAPDYPAKALSDLVHGSVTLEYVVDTSGSTRDIRVLEATPPGVFEHSAVAAVKRWRYNPVVIDGAAVEVPVRTAIRFELPK